MTGSLFWLRRIWRVYRAYVKSSIARDTEFRADFIAKLMHSALWVVFFYTMIEVIFYNTKQVAGWNRAESLALAAVTMITSSVNHLLFMGLWEFPDHIRKGSLDFAVTKPIDALLTVAMRKFSIHNLGQLVSSLGLLAYAVAISGAAVTLPNVAGFLALLACSNIVFFSLMLFTMTLAVYFVRLDNLWVVPYSILDTARFPNEIFSKGLQPVFMYVFPMAFLGTVPAAVLLKNGSPALVGYGILIAVVSLLVARLFWNYSMKHYSSASS